MEGEGDRGREIDGWREGGRDGGREGGREGAIYIHKKQDTRFDLLPATGRTRRNDLNKEPIVDALRSGEGRTTVDHYEAPHFVSSEPHPPNYWLKKAPKRGTRRTISWPRHITRSFVL